MFTLFITYDRLNIDFVKEEIIIFIKYFILSIKLFLRLFITIKFGGQKGNQNILGINKENLQPTK